MDRRDLLKTMGAAAALPVVAGDGAPQDPPQAPAGPPWTGPAGTASDPDLVRPKVPWPKVMTAPELATLAALCDTIIPADEKSPSASAVGAHEYLNEWASAPYEGQRNGLITIRGGLAWLDREAEKRFGKAFAALAPEERNRIADDICYLPEAKPEFRAAARFFDLVRDLTATAFYTTPEGMKDLEYRGNQASLTWDGPPPEVLRHLGL